MVGVGAAAALVATVLGFALPAAAQAGTAGDDPVRLVTFAARQCASYEDVAANRARNNVQESLRDLGPDSAYRGGDLVDPATEQDQAPRCTPLPGWRFTLGTDDQNRVDTGRWGALSRVLEPYAADIVTRAATPLLDRNGNATGTDLPGAVTFRLTDAQIAQAAQAGAHLWAQGGVPGDPVLDRVYPNEYGFAALRCTVDALNGDNVEFITFPTGSRHVFCFAYYVKPPPTSGRITVRKQVEGDATGRTPFRFDGNISYTEDRSFTLEAGSRAPAEESFYRAGGQTWSFIERDLPPGWERSGLACASETGASTAFTNVTGGETSVQLAAGDNVVCTYTNRFTAPPRGRLQVAKQTVGGAGTFAFDIDGPDPFSTSVTTREEGVPVSADARTARTGEYTIDETLPDPTPAGRWRLADASCNGTSVGSSLPFTVDLSESGLACLLTNEFVPSGSITLRKETEGATGTADFLVRPAADRSDSYEREATTDRPGVSVAAGQRIAELELGTYEIVETRPVPPGRGFWKLESVLCDGVPTGAAQGRAEITLTAVRPDMDCTFINRLQREPEPLNPSLATSSPGEELDPGRTAAPGTVVTGGPSAPATPSTPTTPAQGAALNAANGPLADLAISKSVSTPRAAPGQRLRYRITVANRGPGIAYDVVVTESRPELRRPIRIRSSRGSCPGVRPVRCTIGRLAAGRRAVIDITTSAASTVGRHVNHVAAASSTHDARLSNNRARVTVTVRQPRSRPRFTG